MKRTIAAVTLAMMLLGAGAAFADTNPSPTATKVTEEAKDTSPKTSDFNIIYVEGLGIALAGVAVAARLRSGKE